MTLWFIDNILFYQWKGPGQLTPDKVLGPTSPYGASKVFVESLGRYYARRGLEVVCLRFGGVNEQDSPDVGEKIYPRIWLSHRDCVELIKTCLEAEKIPDNFLIIYGVSDNKGRIHDFSNPLGWKPIEGSS